MGRYLFRPGYSVHYGPLSVNGNGNILGDNNANTGVWYESGGGSIQVYGEFDPNVIPAGRDVIAVRVGHRGANDFFGLYNGWPASYLRINNQRVPTTYLYKQSGIGSTIYGPSLYKTAGLGGWSAEEINLMSTDVGAAVGEMAPVKGRRWCGAVEVLIAVVWDDPVPVPAASFPANNQTVETSSVNFQATLPASQEEQPVRAVFQVARDANFTTDVRTFIGGLNSSTVAGTKSLYTSRVRDNTYTDLGPGTWYLRIKGRDYTDKRESSWSATTKFTVAHPALPIPNLTRPLANETVATPYSIRSGELTVDPPGERIVGIEWQFSQQSNFTGTTVGWQNRQGAFTKSAVSYNPQPDGQTLPGIFGPKVSAEDPDQYLKQGTWYGRVRAVDKYGQVGAWSTATQFTVQHKPYATGYFPSSGQAFDQNATPVRWQFADPWNEDIQSAYRMVVTDLSGNTLQDTGKITSSVPQATMNVGPDQLQKQLRYTVTLWDLDDVPSTDNPTQNFFMSVSPVITVIYPAEGESIITGQPTLEWSVQFARPDVTQKSWKLDYVRRDNQVVRYSTGVVTGTETTHTPPRAVLENVTEYQVKLTITDSDNLSATLVQNFYTDFERPEGATTSASSENYSATGNVLVGWSANVDPFFAEWRIYRRKVDEAGYAIGDWMYVGTEENVDAREYKDWLVAGSSDYRYSVTQVAYRFGALVESAFDEFGDRVTVFGEDYWLLVPERPELNVRLTSVRGDKFTDKRETASHVIINGGRRVNYGTKIGAEGSLSCQIRHSAGYTATQQLQVLERLCDENIWVLMRDPFGNVTKVSLGEVSVDRLAGVGNNEFADIEIPYYEVG